MGDITTEQKELVRKTWAIVETDKVKHGKDFFVELFESFPEYISYFEKFNVKSKGDIATNEKFAEEHIVGKVMNAIGKTINSLDDAKGLEASLVQLGKNHIKRNVLQPQFENAKQVLIKVLGRNLGPHWTEAVRDAWTTTLNAAFSFIYKGLDSA